MQPLFQMYLHMVAVLK